MVKHFLSLTYIALALCLIVAPAAVAGNSSKVSFSQSVVNLIAGQETPIELIAADVPPIYGVELSLKFNPEFLEIVDFDKKTPVIELEPGAFLNPAKAFFLQNTADNKTGSINYVMTLLNPAPEAQGNGILFRALVKAKKSGTTTIEISKAKFGASQGQTFEPSSVTGLNITVATKEEAVAKEKSNHLKIITIAMIAFILASLLIVVFIRKKRSVKQANAA
jgi:hypothetical protein